MSEYPITTGTEYGDHEEGKICLHTIEFVCGEKQCVGDIHWRKGYAKRVLIAEKIVLPSGIERIR